MALLRGPPPRLNVTSKLAAVNVMSPYEPYAMAGVTQLVDAQGNVTRVANLSGLSAVGWSGKGSQFAALVDARDSFNRSLGWAVGLVTNNASVSAYAASRWLFSGLQCGDCYLQPPMLPLLVQLCRNMSMAPLPVPAPTWPPARPATAGFVQISADRRHLLYPDGKRFFLLGMSYYYLLD